MKLHHTSFAAFLLLAGSITAPAATTVSFNLGGSACANPSAGLCSSVAGANEIDFNSADAPSPFVSGAATFSFLPGDVSPFVTGSLSGEYAAPPSDQTRYLSVGSPSRASSVTIDFDTPISYYGLYLGSPDAYNVFSFFETGNNVNPIATFTGDDLIPPGQGNQAIGSYVNFLVNGGTVSRIVLSSGQAALETDNHAYLAALPNDQSGVPEPATMSLLGSAFLGLAVFARRSKSN